MLHITVCEDNPSELLMLDSLIKEWSSDQKTEVNIHPCSNASQVLFLLEGYDVEAVSYLLKPVRRERLFFCLEKAVERRKREEPVLLLEAAGETIKVKIKDICYTESVSHNTLVHLQKAKEPVCCRVGIAQMAARIEEQSHTFFKIHRSFLINLAYVDRITRRDVVMENGSVLPVARGKWEELNRACLRFYRRKQDME